MNRIHPTAIIDDRVQLGDDNVIGPYTSISGDCVIGNQNWIGPNVVIGGPVAIRGRTHAGWDEEPDDAGVWIGDRNTIREHVGIQLGSNQPSTIGDDCYLMANVHLSHDATIGHNVTITCGSMLAGHVTIGAGSNLGMGTLVHQRVRIGAGVMAGMGSVIVRDVPDFALIFGNPARVRGANKVGLDRAGYGADEITQIDGRLREMSSIGPE